MNSTAEVYMELVGEGSARLALLACSAALRLDDNVAREAIELVSQSNGSTDKTLRRIKRLGCVWKQWDGSWYIAEDVRSSFLEQLYEEVPEATVVELRERLATHASRRAHALPDGQITAYRTRQAEFEAAYQRMLIPERTEEGAVQLAEVWHKAPGSAAQATAESADYLAEEIDRYLHHLPDSVLFLRGMAARARGDKQGQIKYFGAVWRNGGYGYVYGFAAHLYGLLIRDRNNAEQAFRDSMDWYPIPAHQGQVWHSLGNLLSKDKRRWKEAEDAYEQSIKLRDDPAHKGQVWHSLGNLLSKDRRRWKEAEDAYEQSIKLRDDPAHKGQVLASWAANLLSKYETDEGDERAEEFALRSLELDPGNPWTNGVCYRVLADVYEHQNRLEEAVEMLESLEGTNRKLRITKFEEAIQKRIERLRRKLRNRSNS